MTAQFGFDLCDLLPSKDADNTGGTKILVPFSIVLPWWRRWVLMQCVTKTRNDVVHGQQLLQRARNDMLEEGSGHGPAAAATTKAISARVLFMSEISNVVRKLA